MADFSCRAAELRGQIIGKDDRLPPEVRLPGGDHSESHWSNASTMDRYADKVPIPYVTAQREALGLSEDQPALAIFDVFKAHRCPELLAKLKENHIHAVFVPASCTGELQPLDYDGGVNDVLNTTPTSSQQSYRTAETWLRSPWTVMTLSKLKPIHANWVLGAMDSIANNVDAIARGWDRTGIRGADGKTSCRKEAKPKSLPVVTSNFHRCDTEATPECSEFTSNRGTQIFGKGKGDRELSYSNMARHQRACRRVWDPGAENLTAFPKFLKRKTERRITVETVTVTADGHRASESLTCAPNGFTTDVLALDSRPKKQGACHWKTESVQNDIVVGLEYPLQGAKDISAHNFMGSGQLSIYVIPVEKIITRRNLCKDIRRLSSDYLISYLEKLGVSGNKAGLALGAYNHLVKLKTGFRAGPVTVSTSECDVRTLEQETRASIWSTDMRQLPLFKLAAVYAYFITRVHLALQQMNNSALFLLRPDFNKFDLEGLKTDLRKVSAELEMDDHDNHVEWRKCLKRREELEEKWSTQRPRTTWPLKQLIKRISELKRNTPGPATQPRHTTELLRARREAEQVEIVTNNIDMMVCKFSAEGSSRKNVQKDVFDKLCSWMDDLEIHSCTVEIVGRLYPNMWLLASVLMVIPVSTADKFESKIIQITTDPQVRDLESKLHTEQRRHQETLKNLREYEHCVKELRFQACCQNILLNVFLQESTPEHTDAPTLISTIPSLIFTMMSTWLTLHQHLHVTDAVWDVLPINGNRKVDTETLRGKCSHLLSIPYAEATPPAADLMKTDLHQVDMTRERKADCIALPEKEGQSCLCFISGPVEDTITGPR
ncbi:hypothetical protein Bbelb_049080 [Branchiostoma belcheri]|nr:hypothetical protein Bbelb_049080 [Branchiostoma belcheri]